MRPSSSPKPRAIAWLFQPVAGKPSVYLDRGRAELAAGGTRGQLHDLHLHEPLSDEGIARGLTIADTCMLELLRSECVKTDEVGQTYSLPFEHERYGEIFDAVTWLIARGLVTMLGDDGVLITAEEEVAPW